MNDDKTCINCVHYKAVKCEKYGWIERQGNFNNEPCKDFSNDEGIPEGCNIERQEEESK